MMDVDRIRSSRDQLTPLKTAPSAARTELIRRLGASTFNYWFGYVANLSLVVWMVGHAFRPGAAIPGPTGFALYAAAGLASWTLAEYLLHRFVYHEWSSFLSHGHSLHHDRPRDLIGVPWYLTTIAIVLLFKLLTLMFSEAATGLVMGFNWLGYIFYCLLHHGSHHWRPTWKWWNALKRHHLIHHGHPGYNWGVTTTIWDTVFGTSFVRANASRAQVGRDV